MSKRKLLAGLAGITLFLAMGVMARADSADFTIDVPNAGLSGTPGPYATVHLELVGNTIEVTVTMLSPFNTFGNGGGNGAFGFNVVGSETGLAVTSLVGNNGDPLTADLSGGTFDGFGKFDVGIQDGTPNNGLTVITFTVSRTDGFSSVNDLVEASCGGEFCGAHFAVHVSPGPNIATGFAGDSGTPVPEPASLTLLGTGLLGLAGVVRRRLRLK